MRKELIESYVSQLQDLFGNIRPPVDDDELLRLFNRKDYAGMIALVKKILRLDLRVTMGVVNLLENNAPAKIDMPERMPLRVTAEFRQTRVIVYLRRSFLHEASFEEVVIAIAHELSHVVMESSGHTLHAVEEVVDLTAMWLGFRDFYITGCHIVRRAKEQSSVYLERFDVRRNGYLSREEVQYAAHIMTFGSPPPR